LAPSIERLKEPWKEICYKGIISCEANTFEGFEKDVADLMAFSDIFINPLQIFTC